MMEDINSLKFKKKIRFEVNKTRYKDKDKGKLLPRRGHEDSKGGERSSPRPGHFTPRKETRHRLYRRLVGPKD